MAVDLNTLSLSQLVAAHNALVTVERQVKKFSTKPIGVARVQGLLDQTGWELVLEESGAISFVSPELPVDENGEQPAPEEAEEAPAPAPVKGRKSKAKAAKVKAQRATYAETAVITVVKPVVAREGSLRAKRAAVLVSGMTVGAYLDAAAAANEARRSRHKYHSDLLRLARGGFVTIE